MDDSYEIHRQLRQEHQVKINSYLNEIQQYQTLQEQKNIHIVQLDNHLKKLEKELAEAQYQQQKFVNSKEQFDASTQCPHIPTHKQLGRDNIKDISAKLRYRLRRKRINQAEIADYLFPNSDTSFAAIQNNLQR